MSEYEQHKGTAKFTPANDAEHLEKICQSICENKGWEKAHQDCWLHVLEDEGYRTFIISESGIYEIVGESEIDDDGDVFEAETRADGTISFVLRYYNGGCGFDEAFVTAIDNMNSKQQS